MADAGQVSEMQGFIRKLGKTALSAVDRACDILLKVNGDRDVEILKGLCSAERARRRRR